MAEVAAMNVRAVATQISGLRGLIPPPPARRIPMFRRRLSVSFASPVSQTLKIRHALGHSIHNVGTSLNETLSVRSRHA
jgi:hypothetical protein